MSLNETEGWVKVIGDAKTDKLLGVHMIGPEVTELIAEAALAIEMGATVSDLSADDPRPPDAARGVARGDGGGDRRSRPHDEPVAGGARGGGRVRVRACVP
jgi:hypothetical protein